MPIDQVGVVGGGRMGSGIAEVCARAGYGVVVWDVDAAAVERSRSAVGESMTKAVGRGKATEGERSEALARIDFTTELSDAAASRLVIEAIVEDEALKVELLGRLDQAAPPEAILASNTSSIPIARLAAATARPDKVIGLHFFNPPPLMPLVEVIPSRLTSRQTIAEAEEFVGSLGKQGVRAPDRAGFIVNAILMPMLVDAARMADAGVAAAEDIDRALVLGASLPIGPLALADFVGIDIVVAVSDVLFEEFRDAKYAVPPSMRRMVEAGNLGRKTGRGFFEYE